ncbi:MAG: Uncharacterized protein LiPW41_516 [Parcubacteria group bacterium LiPW_41]|nr:MAG: Uncharacterized protein LiPW41_516 [Parcubacteria group bacterium LiPW_41]
MCGQRKGAGFTLIELLVVIAILAILATVIVVIINPGELLKQSRDSTRLSDLATINKTLGLLLVDQSNIYLGEQQVYYVSIPDPALSGSATSTCSTFGFPTPPSGWRYECHSPDFFQKVDGTGWIPVNLTSLSTGSILSRLPKDPSNATSSGTYYVYSVKNNEWEIDARMESTKYGYRTDLTGKPSLDRGNNEYLYETGSNLTVILDPENRVVDGDMEAAGVSGWIDYSTPILKEKVTTTANSGSQSLHLLTDLGAGNEGTYYGFTAFNPTSRRVFRQVYYKAAPGKTFGWTCICSNTSCCWEFTDVSGTQTGWTKKILEHDTSAILNVYAVYFSQPGSVPSEFYIDDVIVRPMY